MNSSTITQTQQASGILPIAMSILIGLGIVFVAGHVQATAIHDTAHDVRHATGFPCH